MPTHSENRLHADNQVTLPRHNVEWSEAIVKWTRYDHVAMYDYPTTQNSETVMEIFKGDMVQVSRRYRREDWCLCQVGHVLGWVFLQDVRFIVQGAKSPMPQRPTQYSTQSVFSTMPDTNEVDTAPPLPRIKHDMLELETQPTVRQTILKPEDGEDAVEDSTTFAEEHAEKKPMIQRLISFFKR